MLSIGFDWFTDNVVLYENEASPMAVKSILMVDVVVAVRC